MYTRRLIQLYLGLGLYGLSVALMVHSGLGLNPWDVFHQGLAAKLDLSIGTTIIVVGVLVMLLWIPLRLRPGLGTISNVLVIGLTSDLFIGLLSAPESVWLRAASLVIGVLFCGIGSAAYIGAGFGPGPRDGLMTGLASRTGWSVGRVRTSIELTVLAAGWLLGGTVGLGTILFALAIGPLIQFFLPILTPVRQAVFVKP